MTKNKALRLGSVMLVLALITTCAISGTFAKYVTKAPAANDAARVAYWGFSAPASITLNLFNTSYNSNAVKSSDSDKVVAPGTTQTSNAFGLAYTKNTNDSISAPEVKYEFKVDVTTSGTTTNLDDNADFKWTLKASNAATATPYSTLEDLTNAIKALSGDSSGTKTYAAGTLPDKFVAADGTNITYQVGWVWDFEDSGKTDDQNADDTTLGNGDALENVNITIQASATQLAS